MTETAMTEARLSSPGLDITSAGAKAHLRRRYAAEARFRWYGLAAIAIAALFLVVLVGDIVRKAVPAFSVSYVDLAVPISKDIVDPAGSGDAKTVAGADFAKLIREGLYAQFPQVTARSTKKSLAGLVSTGAADALARRVVAAPSLIGSSLRMPLLLSDTADLYLEGASAAHATTPGPTPATPSATSGAVTVQSTGTAFAALMARLGPAAAELGASQPSVLVTINGGIVKASRVAEDRIEGEAIVPLLAAGEAAAGAWSIQTIATPEGSRKITDAEIGFLEMLRAKGMLSHGANWLFLASGDSREAELAGILGALVGSALTMLVTLALSLPIGVLAAIYLEEFAPKNRLTDLIEVNINNLAAVPSIVFGLLGLAVFLNIMGMPRSAPLVGGLVLALLVLPTIIIASRAALKAVPPSIREAALGVGASRQQAVFHHVLPLAMPGILTGTIIGMAHALGETAPLLMIGMVAFIVDVPAGVTDAATVLPVQIFLWSDLPEVGFQAKTAAAIIVLLLFLFAMNGIAILLRRRFERRW